MSADFLLADTIGFTASRGLDEAGCNQVVIPVLNSLPFVSRYVTGGCRGGDAFIGEWLYVTVAGAEHVVIVPVNRSQVDPWWLRYPEGAVTVIEMPPGSTYADRNQRINHESDALIGFPAYLEKDYRSLRSGTWQTIRIADRAGTLAGWHCVHPPYDRKVSKWIEARQQ